MSDAALEIMTAAKPYALGLSMLSLYIWCAWPQWKARRR